MDAVLGALASSCTGNIMKPDSQVCRDKANPPLHLYPEQFPGRPNPGSAPSLGTDKGSSLCFMSNMEHREPMDQDLPLELPDHQGR